MTPKRSYNYSAATIELMQAGVSVSELARRLDLSPTAVSRKLKGELGGPTGDLGDLIVELAGSEVYERILHHLGLTEELEDAIADVEVRPE